jgi:hypothetical protein
VPDGWSLFVTLAVRRGDPATSSAIAMINDVVKPTAHIFLLADFLSVIVLLPFLSVMVFLSERHRGG